MWRMSSDQLCCKRMNNTLLLDLDDTLLNSNMDEFIPAYFKLLSLNLQDIIEPGVMFNGLMKGTNKMLKKTSPEGSLSDVFSSEFYELIQVPEKDLAPRLEYFYDEVFPELGSLTSIKPDAIEFVEKAFKQDDRVVIATNPLFPLKAVEHRLRWAGLAPEDYQFSLITAFEDFHFAKENIAYFPEIFGRLGWPDGPVLMVGNDFSMDIEPARKAGFPVFWVPDGSGSYSIHDDIPTGHLGDVFPWIEDQPIENLLITFDDLVSIKSVLSATPAVFHGWLNPKGKFRLTCPDSDNNKVINIISDLAEAELKNIKTLAELLDQNRVGINDIPLYLHPLPSEDQIESTQPLNDFLCRRLQLLDLIGCTEDFMGGLNRDEHFEIIEMLKVVVIQDINSFRIAI